MFGGPYIEVNGARREIPEGSKRLLVFVALRRTRVERRHAAGALWPTCTDERAAGNLRSALWRLRGAQIDLLVTDKQSLSLSRDVLLDLDLVNDWASRLVAGTARPQDLTLAPQSLDALDLLPGWYDDWAVIERERLRQRILHALEALSQSLIMAGRWAEAVDAAMAAVAVEPLRETAQRMLVEAHMAEGNRIEGQRCLDAYRKLLRRELDIEPPPDLMEILRSPRRAIVLEVAGEQAHAPRPRLPSRAGLEVGSPSSADR
jgi:DNA-binding SARP family transcriptional activator